MQTGSAARANGFSPAAKQVLDIVPDLSLWQGLGAEFQWAPAW